MEITNKQADEIAAECIAAVKFQTDLFSNPNASREGLMAAITPQRPATVKLAEWMSPFKSSEGISEKVVLMPKTVTSMAQILDEQGYPDLAEDMQEAVRQANIVLAMSPVPLRGPNS